VAGFKVITEGLDTPHLQEQTWIRSVTDGSALAKPPMILSLELSALRSCPSHAGAWAHLGAYAGVEYLSGLSREKGAGSTMIHR
jgi:hypothetical protein